MFNAMTTIAEDSARHLQSLQNAHFRLLESLVPGGGGDARQPHPAMLPLMRAHAYSGVYGKLATRHLMSLQGLWSWMLQPRVDYGVFEDALAMQRAILERLAAQQADWARGLETIAAETAAMRNVNTLSKLMDQEYDVLSQFGALVSAQATAMVELLENIQIGTGYLLARRAGTPAS